VSIEMFFAVLSLTCHYCTQDTPGCFDMDQPVPTKICKEGEYCLMFKLTRSGE